ncbi:hypothetical protein KAH81_09040 [bacterium]|nr:hypothetical protein [bacterium]
MKRLITIAIVAFAFAGIGFAAEDTADDTTHITIAEVAMIDNSGALGDFSFTAPTAEGDTLDHTGPDANSYLQYTSTVVEGNARTISAELDTMLQGLKMTIAAGAPGGTGTCGTQTSTTFTVDDNDAADIVTAIGSGQTGTGATDGPNLTISVFLDAEHPEELFVAAETEILITYTLTEDAVIE